MALDKLTSHSGDKCSNSFIFTNIYFVLFFEYHTYSFPTLAKFYVACWLSWLERRANNAEVMNLILLRANGVQS